MQSNAGEAQTQGARRGQARTLRPSTWFPLGPSWKPSFPSFSLQNSPPNHLQLRCWRDYDPRVWSPDLLAQDRTAWRTPRNCAKQLYRIKPPRFSISQRHEARPCSLNSHSQMRMERWDPSFHQDLYRTTTRGPLTKWLGPSSVHFNWQKSRFASHTWILSKLVLILVLRWTCWCYRNIGNLEQQMSKPSHSYLRRRALRSWLAAEQLKRRNRIQRACDWKLHSTSFIFT